MPEGYRAIATQCYALFAEWHTMPRLVSAFPNKDYQCEWKLTQANAKLSGHLQEILDIQRVLLIELKKSKEHPMSAYQQKTNIVHERVAFGEKVSKVERRSGAGSHRSGTLTEYAQEGLEASKVQQARNAVRPRQDLNPDPRAKEY